LTKKLDGHYMPDSYSVRFGFFGIKEGKTSEMAEFLPIPDAESYSILSESIFERKEQNDFVVSVFGSATLTNGTVVQFTQIFHLKLEKAFRAYFETLSYYNASICNISPIVKVPVSNERMAFSTIGSQRISPKIEPQQRVAENKDVLPPKESPKIEKPVQKKEFTKPNIVEEKKAPVEEKKAPVEEKKAPVEEKKAPVEEKKAPVEEKKAPIEEKKAPVEEKKAPIETKREKTYQKSSQFAPYIPGKK